MRPGVIHRAALILIAAAFAAACVAPYLTRLGHPSLYSDDILRIADLKTTSLCRLMVRPFNEHFAPLFEVVSWSAWKLAGHSLVDARWTFTLASYVPYLSCLVFLGVLLQDQTGSITSALVGVAIFAISSLYAEVIFWYSASSFSWALLFSIATLHMSGRGCDDLEGKPRSRVLSMFSAGLAPMGSGLGLLAGPLGSIRAGFSRRPTRLGDRLLGIIFPSIGTIAYLLLGGVFRYQSALSASVRENADFVRGLWHAFRAPVVVLIPGLFGFSNIEGWISPPGQAVLSGIFWAGMLFWSIRSSRRSLLLGALWLILGGYLLTYPLRVRKQSLDLLDYQRYHLFPQLGLALLVTCALVPVLRRFDARPIRSLALATAIAFGLLVFHQSEMRSRANFYRFSQQSRTFRAIEHLESICRRESITRRQALAALDPLRSRWFPHDFNALTLLGPTVADPRLPDPLVRDRLLAALSFQEREALFGFMDATPHAGPATSDLESIALGRLVDRRSIRLSEVPDDYIASGWPAYLEFDLAGPSERSLARFLVFPGFAPSGPVEVWWSDGLASWSEFRSFRWRPDPCRSPRDWAIPIDSLPHLNPAETRRIRVYFRGPGPVALCAPRLAR